MTGQTPITAAALMAKRPLFLDHPCQAWDGSIVRLARLEPIAYVELAERYERLPRDEDEKVSVEDRYAWGAEVIAASMTDAEGNLQFTNATARQWLAREPAAIRELLDVCMQFNGLGRVTDGSHDAEKKN